MIQKSPNNLLETWVGFAAILGAITGTLALAIQLIQHLADRPKLVLQSSMGIKSDGQNPKLHLYVRLQIVNNGRRPTRIERAWFKLPESTGPILPELLQSKNVKLVSSEFVIFDAETKGRFIEISSEGGKYVFENSIPQNLAHAMFQELKEGKAFVRLTSGKELMTTFCLVNPNDLLKSG